MMRGYMLRQGGCPFNFPRQTRLPSRVPEKIALNKMTETDKAIDSAEMAEYISDTRQARLNRVQQMSSDDFTRIEKRLK